MCKAAEDGLMLLRGFTPERMRSLVAESLETVLRPLVYAEPLRFLERHRERGEPVYIVSAALQEVVDAIADDLGFDGALGTICEVEDGVYTGRRALAARRARRRRCASSPRRRASTSPRRPRTRTATPTCRSSRPSATRSRSHRTASFASPPSAGLALAAAVPSAPPTRAA